MTPIPPIPADLKVLYADALDAHAYADSRQRANEVKYLIERIAKLTAERDKFLTEINQLYLQQEALEAENTRLKAPVSDEELTPHCLGKKYFLTEVFDKLIASRATRTPPQEASR